MMTLLSVADCCRRLAIDPKTLRRWLQAAQLALEPHPADGRSKGLRPEHLQQLALAHRRTLLGFEAPSPAEPATSRPEPTRVTASPTEPVLPISDLLAALLAVQEQLGRLSHQLEQLLPPTVVDPARPGAPGEGQPALDAAAVVPVTALQQAELAASRPRTSARVLPLVEYGRDGHYVVICPQEGRLGFEPDSAEWFAWLSSRSSFRFVGKEGHFTAHREVSRLPNAVWRAHRKLRNHTCNQRLAHTPDLTSSMLEQAAATLQAHLK